MVSRGIALLFHDRGTRRGWVVSSTSRPHFTTGIDPVPIVQETGWAPGPVWTGGKSRPHRDSILDRPARSQSLYRLSCLAYCRTVFIIQTNRVNGRWLGGFFAELTNTRQRLFTVHKQWFFFINLMWIHFNLAKWGWYSITQALAQTSSWWLVPSLRHGVFELV